VDSNRAAAKAAPRKILLRIPANLTKAPCSQNRATAGRNFHEFWVNNIKYN